MRMVAIAGGNVRSAAVDEVEQASANFYLVGAVFAPTLDLSIECMKKYLELQQQIFERQMGKLLKEIASTLP